MTPAGQITSIYSFCETSQLRRRETSHCAAGTRKRREPLRGDEFRRQRCEVRNYLQDEDGRQDYDPLGSVQPAVRAMTDSIRQG
jgi:hypothetical protein